VVVEITSSQSWRVFIETLQCMYNARELIRALGKLQLSLQ